MQGEHPNITKVHSKRAVLSPSESLRIFEYTGVDDTGQEWEFYGSVLITTEYGFPLVSDERLYGFAKINPAD